MVYVKLLRDVAEGNLDFEKAMVAAKASGQRPPRLKTNPIRGKIVPFIKGAIIAMHETGAKKYAERGLGKVVKGPEE